VAKVCIGKQYALTLAGFTIARLVQKFDRIENMDAAPRLRHLLTLTSVSASGVQVRLHETKGGPCGEIKWQ